MVTNDLYTMTSSVLGEQRSHKPSYLLAQLGLEIASTRNTIPLDVASGISLQYALKEVLGLIHDGRE